MDLLLLKKNACALARTAILHFVRSFCVPIICIFKLWIWNEKLFKVLWYFKPTATGGVYSLSEKEIAGLIRSDKTALDVNEVSGLINKLEQDGYIVYDQPKYNSEYKGVPLYRYYSITKAGEAIFRRGKYSKQNIWTDLYVNKPVAFWIGIIVALATISSIVLVMLCY